MIKIRLISNNFLIFYRQKLCLNYPLRFEYKSLFLSFISGNTLSCYIFLGKIGLMRLPINKNEY